MTLAAGDCHYFQAALILTLQKPICQPQSNTASAHKRNKPQIFPRNSKAFDCNAEINLNSAVSRQEEKPKHTLVS